MIFESSFYYRPGFIFIENVPGIERKPDSPLSPFKEFLSRKKYRYVEKVINARHYGVPQNRRRYVLLASRVNENIDLPPKKATPNLNVKNAIGDTSIFYPITAGHRDKSGFIHTAARLSDLNLKRIRNTPHNGGSRREWANDPELQVQCYKNHQGHWDVYGRMRWSTVSPTITTRFNSYSNGRYGHPEQDRAISLREGATLQSFPLKYSFYSDKQANIAKMIGNAVPPELAKRIALEIMKIYKESNGKVWQSLRQAPEHLIY